MTNLPLFDSTPDRPVSPRIRIVTSSSAVSRLAAAREAVGLCPVGARVWIVGASRTAADDLAREVAGSRSATFGIERASLTQLAAKMACTSLAALGRSPCSGLGAEAVATRAAFEVTRDLALRYFAPVAATPGFPRALAKTLQELRLGEVDSPALASLQLGGSDLAVLLDRVERGLIDASSADRADLFHAATAGLRERPHLVVFLDVPLDHAAERHFVAAVISRAGASVATVPSGDQDTIRHLVNMGGVVEETRSEAPAASLSSVGRFLFDADAQPPVQDLDGSVEFFSAPGEGRECVEIVRRLLKEARAGVRFDEMAVLVRSPQAYAGLLEHALGRGGVPAWFDRGTRRPHPAGRAFLALLACAAEQLSAARFAEYLSLGQVPDPDRPVPGDVAEVLPADEAFALPDGSGDDVATGEVRATPDGTEAGADEDEESGPGMRAPWRWEKLLVESAVIGRDASRWRRRLAGKSAEIDTQIREAAREDGPGGNRAAALGELQEQLQRLQAFALPIIETLAGLPRRASWGEWLDCLTRLAPAVLRRPDAVLRVLAELRPMATVGPIELDEVRRVLAERLLTLESSPPRRRFGRVFVGTPEQARGRAFRVVFVPGLAERMFPQKPREDPLLLDELRSTADVSLATQPRRLAAERLLLQLAAGAASERLYVSYPRIELNESRARVPSFYALDIMRAATGRVPDYEWLEARARGAGNATLAWPAPAAPEDAIDEQEHDLAVLRRLLDERDRHAVKGHAHYLLKLNECLRRSVVNRWARGEPRWSTSDGLTRVSTDTASLFASQRLTARSYSLSALQRFASCPYQFVLNAFYGLHPFEQAESLQRMDPLTRGSLFHEMQARFLRSLQSSGRLPVVEPDASAAAAVLDATVDEVASRAYDLLAPAVDRVWADEVVSIRQDLHGWLARLVRDGSEWLPEYFEYGFGVVPGERDPRSSREDVVLPGGYRLRGAVDLIEEHLTTRVLRVTDHKTGRPPERLERIVVGGGGVLQPVLYAMAVEAALCRSVSEGRLFYCTSTGRFTEHVIPLNDTTRASGTEVLEIVDRAIASGFLPATPTDEACDRCDYRAVCGPDMFRRSSRKPQDRLADLRALRSLA